MLHIGGADFSATSAATARGAVTEYYFMGTAAVPTDFGKRVIIGISQSEPGTKVEAEQASYPFNFSIRYAYPKLIAPVHPQGGINLWWRNQANTCMR